MYKILVINTGSTSTKTALYEESAELFKENLKVSAEALVQVTRAIQQLPDRTKSIMNTLERHRVDIRTLDIIAARGGTLPDIRGGAYRATDYMVAVAAHVGKSQHESSLVYMIGLSLAHPYGIPVIIYDAVGTNEADDVAQVMGCPGMPGTLCGHTLNSRIAAKSRLQSLVLRIKIATLLSPI